MASTADMNDRVIRSPWVKLSICAAVAHTCGPANTAWRTNIPGPALFYRWQYHANTHRHVVGDGLRVGPFGLADLVVEALDGEAALGDAVAGGVLLEHDRHHRIAADALDRQRASDFVLVAAEILDVRGDEFRDRKLGGVEPFRALDLGLGRVTGEVHTAQFDVEFGLGPGELLGQEHDIGLPPTEAALDIDAHLLRHEADFALVDEYTLCRRLGRGEQHHAQRWNKRTQKRHDQPFFPMSGSMRARTASRSTKWCLSAATVCRQTSPSSVKFNVWCTTSRIAASWRSLDT